MLVTHIHRHGWRHASLAFVNFLLWFGVVLQLGGLMAMGSSRSIYIQLSNQLGFHEGTLMGSGFLFGLLGPAGFWGLAVVAIVTLAKEFARLTLPRRLLINGTLFLGALGLASYVVTMLHYLPVERAAT